MRSGRKTPYTAIGIRRLKCVRCGNPATAQWNSCADGVYRPVCEECDVEINRIVLRFFRDPEAKAKLRKYQRRVR